jgi:hypothetical protein
MHDDCAPGLQLTGPRPYFSPPSHGFPLVATLAASQQPGPKLQYSGHEIKPRSFYLDQRLTTLLIECNPVSGEAKSWTEPQPYPHKPLLRSTMARLFKSLRNGLSQRRESQDPESWRGTCDVAITSGQADIKRTVAMFFDSQCEDDLMSSRCAESFGLTFLNSPRQVYGVTITGHQVYTVGQIHNARWRKLVREEPRWTNTPKHRSDPPHFYWTDFRVIESEAFDIIIGRKSINQHNLLAKNARSLPGFQSDHNERVSTMLRTVQQPKEAQEAAQKARDRPDHSGSEHDKRPSAHEESQLSSKEATLPLLEYDVWERLDVEADRRSLMSKTSSMTLWSSFSGDTAVEMEGVTSELLMVFQDSELLKLYRMAMQDMRIGPEVLQLNLRRMIKSFAQELKPEATNELEKLTCHFVRKKARYVAQCIVEEYYEKPIPSFPPHLLMLLKTKVEARDPDEDEEVEGDQTAQEDSLENFADLKTFLIQSKAFKAFRQRLQDFAVPKKPISLHILTTSTEPLQSTSWVSCVRIIPLLKVALATLRILEPPLRPGMVRLRWQCVS